MDEGVDIPSVGAVVLAGGMKSRIKFIQRIGRGSRRKKVGPNYVYVLDFWDGDHVYLRSHSKKRRAMAEDIEAEIVDDMYEFNNRVHYHAEELKRLESGV